MFIPVNQGLISRATMSFNEKFQAGEAYGDVEDESTNFFADPLKVATAILKDCEGVRSQASLGEIVGLINELLHKGEPLDDRKG